MTKRDIKKTILNHELRLGFSESSIPGTFLAQAHAPCMPMPVGTVWYRLLRNGTVIEILHSYVIESYRRQGVRTFLHRQLIESYKSVELIFTDGDTPSSRKWLAATGFKKRQPGNCWEYTINR